MNFNSFKKIENGTGISLSKLILHAASSIKLISIQSETVTLDQLVFHYFGSEDCDLKTVILDQL